MWHSAIVYYASVVLGFWRRSIIFRKRITCQSWPTTCSLLIRHVGHSEGRRDIRRRMAQSPRKIGGSCSGCSSRSSSLRLLPDPNHLPLILLFGHAPSCQGWIREVLSACCCVTTEKLQASGGTRTVLSGCASEKRSGSSQRACHHSPDQCRDNTTTVALHTRFPHMFSSAPQRH